MEKILSRLTKVRARGKGKYMACCPAHEDKSPSLSLYFNPDGRVLIHCFAGCGPNDVLAAIGLSLSDLYPDGAIQDFMASAASGVKPTENGYLEYCDMARKYGRRLPKDVLKKEREQYLKTRGKS